MIDVGSVCACMGPQNGEPMCPCMMRVHGLVSAPIWTDAKREQLREALRKIAVDKSRLTGKMGYDDGN